LNDNLDIKYSYCIKCDKTMDINVFYTNKQNIKNSYTKCRICTWKNNNKGYNIKGWNSVDIDDFIYFIFKNDMCILNNFIKTHTHISLRDAVNGFSELAIGNRKTRVFCKCDSCGCNILKKPYLYNDLFNYCSNKCYHDNKIKTSKRGSECYNYNSINSKCCNCNKDIVVKKYNYDKLNSFGDRNNFCSHKCYYKYRSKYYIGIKNHNYGRKLSEEAKNKLRINMINGGRLASRLNSKIQLKVNSILDDNNIRYIREYVIKYYAVDNYLVDSRLIIEVMGDYWHSNINIYNNDGYNINKMQQKGIIKDKAKNTYINNYIGTNILYLWERDVNKNIELCKLLILEYIKNNGVLDDYNSFNYSIYNKELCINKNIIKPYHEYRQNEQTQMFESLLNPSTTTAI